MGHEPHTGIGSQDPAERRRFEGEVGRIVEAAQATGLTLRILGSLAFHLHCPQYGHLQAALGRVYTDIDLAGYSREAPAVQKLLSGRLGYTADEMMYVESEGARMMFEHPIHHVHVDVFLDKLEFNHTISWRSRLERDTPTVPLAELLLEKMQIVRINTKDVIDTIVLLLEHPLGDSDDETIDIGRVARLCADDWGLWRTTTMNLEKVKQLLAGFPQLTQQQHGAVADQVDRALVRIAAEPKTLGWRIRNRIGDRMKWHKDVDEVK